MIKKTFTLDDKVVNFLDDHGYDYRLTDTMLTIEKIESVYFNTLKVPNDINPEMLIDILSYSEGCFMEGITVGEQRKKRKIQNMLEIE